MKRLARCQKKRAWFFFNDVRSQKQVVIITSLSICMFSNSKKSIRTSESHYNVKSLNRQRKWIKRGVMCSLIQYPTSLSLHSSVRSVLFIYVRQGDCDKGHTRALFIWSTEDGRTCPSGSVSTSTSPLLSFRTVASASVPFRGSEVFHAPTPHCVLWHLLMSRLCSVFQDILNV